MDAKFNWSKMKSLKLSRAMMFGMFFLLIAALFLIPFMARWYALISMGTGLFDNINAPMANAVNASRTAGAVSPETDVTIPVTIMLYICDVLGIIAMLNLNTLLNNIIKEQVFIERNTQCIRAISWCCFLVGLTLLFFGLWRFAIMFMSFFAFFMGVIMRVLKNVFEKAVELQSESDFTI